MSFARKRRKNRERSSSGVLRKVESGCEGKTGIVGVGQRKVLCGDGRIFDVNGVRLRLHTHGHDADVDVMVIVGGKLLKTERKRLGPVAVRDVIKDGRSGRIDGHGSTVLRIAGTVGHNDGAFGNRRSSRGARLVKDHIKGARRAQRKGLTAGACRGGKSRRRKRRKIVSGSGGRGNSVCSGFHCDGAGPVCDGHLIVRHVFLLCCFATYWILCFGR